MLSLIAAQVIISASPSAIFHNCPHALQLLSIYRALPLRIRIPMSVYEIGGDWAEPDPDHATPFAYDDWQGIAARFPVPEIIVQTGPDVRKAFAYKLGYVAFWHLTETERAGWDSEGFALAFSQTYWPSLFPGADPEVSAGIRKTLGVQAPGF